MLDNFFITLKMSVLLLLKCRFSISGFEGLRKGTKLQINIRIHFASVYNKRFQIKALSNGSNVVKEI